MGRKKTKSAGKSATNVYQSGGATTATLRPADARPQQTPSSTPPLAAIRTVTITYEQTAERAREIWMRNGCRPGEDEQNWLEAETQLKAEMSRP